VGLVYLYFIGIALGVPLWIDYLIGEKVAKLEAKVGVSTHG